MISIPVNVGGAGQDNTFTPADLRGCTIKALYSYYAPAGPDYYVRPSTLSAAQGYWARVDADCQVTMTGIRTSIKRTQLYPGWNLISSKYSWNEINPGAVPAGTTRCTLTAGSSINAYDTTAHAYVTVDPAVRFDDMKGYWVKVTGACQVNEP